MPSQPILVHQDAGRKEVQDVLAVDGQCKVLLLLLTNDQKPWGLATGGGGEPLAKLTLMFGERTFPKKEILFYTISTTRRLGSIIVGDKGF